MLAAEVMASVFMPYTSLAAALVPRLKHSKLSAVPYNDLAATSLPYTDLAATLVRYTDLAATFVPRL